MNMRFLVLFLSFFLFGASGIAEEAAPGEALPVEKADPTEGLSVENSSSAEDLSAGESGEEDKGLIDFFKKYVEVSGYYEFQGANYVDNLDSFLKLNNILDLRVLAKPREDFNFFIHFQKFWDAAYEANSDLNHLKHEMWTNRNPWQGISYIREIYLDYYSDYLDARLGKQQVTWGQADGVKILDVVNPFDNREFTLDEWADSKIPLWMAKFEYSPKVNGTIQFLFIPDFEPNFLAPAGAPWAYRATTIGAERADYFGSLGFQVFEGEDEPAQTFENSKIGLRWRDIIGSFEYTINYLHGYDLYGATEAEVALPPPPPPQLHLTKTYKSIELVGCSFSQAITDGPEIVKGLTIRGEFAWTHNDSVNCQIGNQGFVHRIDTYNYVIGLDKYVVTNWFTSFQFIQFINSRDKVRGADILNSAYGVADQFQTVLSLKVSTDFCHERLKPEILGLWDDDNDYRLSPRLKWEINDRVWLTLGAHFLGGSPDTLFGQFDDNDEYFAELRVSF